MAVRRSKKKQSRARSVPKKRTSAKQRKQRRKNILRAFVFALLLSVFGSLVYLLNLSQFRIDSVEVVGAKNLESHALETAIQDNISGTYLGLFPKDSIFWYGKKDIHDWLLEAYPEIQALELDLQKFDILQVSITEREEKYHAKINGVVYDLDARGVIFKQTNPEKNQAQNQEKNIERLFYSNLASTSAELGAYFIDPEYFIEFNTFLDDLSQRGIEVVKILFENKIQTVLELESGSRIIIHPSDSLDKTSATLQEILPYKEFSYDRQTGVFTNKVEYINFRYGNKLFYCYSGEICENNYRIE